MRLFFNSKNQNLHHLQTLEQIVFQLVPREEPKLGQQSPIQKWPVKYNRAHQPNAKVRFPKAGLEECLVHPLKLICLLVQGLFTSEPSSSSSSSETGVSLFFLFEEDKFKIRSWAVSASSLAGGEEKGWTPRILNLNIQKRGMSKEIMIKNMHGEKQHTVGLHFPSKLLGKKFSSSLFHWSRG